MVVEKNWSPSAKGPVVPNPPASSNLPSGPASSPTPAPAHTGAPAPVPNPCPVQSTSTEPSADRALNPGARADFRADRYLRSSSSNKKQEVLCSAQLLDVWAAANKNSQSGLGGGGSSSDGIVRTTVLILGAGLAGITAARTLHQAGMQDFLVLEATDRVGGRVCEASFCGLTVEAGANWIHGVEKQTNPLFQLGQQIGLKTYMSELEDITARDSNGQYALQNSQLLLLSGIPKHRDTTVVLYFEGEDNKIRSMVKITPTLITAHW